MSLFKYNLNFIFQNTCIYYVNWTINHNYLIIVLPLNFIKIKFVYIIYFYYYSNNPFISF